MNILLVGLLFENDFGNFNNYKKNTCFECQNLFRPRQLCLHVGLYLIFVFLFVVSLFGFF
jgi:hypothetical protein